MVTFDNFLIVLVEVESKFLVCFSLTLQYRSCLVCFVLVLVCYSGSLIKAGKMGRFLLRNLVGLFESSKDHLFSSVLQ